MTTRFSQLHSGRVGAVERALFCDNVVELAALSALSGYPKSSLLFHFQHLHDTHAICVECDSLKVKSITCSTDALQALKLFFAKDSFVFAEAPPVQVIEETATASYMIPETKPVSDSDVYADLSELDSEEQAKDAKKAAKKAAK